MIQQIPFDSLYIDNSQSWSDASVDDFLVYIEETNSVYPFVVAEKDFQGMYKVLDSPQQYYALCALRYHKKDLFPSVPCIINGTDFACIHEYSLNKFNIRKDVVQFLYRHATEKKGLSDPKAYTFVAARISEKFRFSKRYAYMFARVILRGSEGLQELVDKGVLTVKKASRLMGLPKKKQEIFWELVDKGEDPAKLIKSFS